MYINYKLIRILLYILSIYFEIIIKFKMHLFLLLRMQLSNTVIGIFLLFGKTI